MLEALSLRDIIKNVQYRHEYDERCIVGIMLARYNIRVVQNLIDESYLYWDTTTDRAFDVYWCGYGEYAVPEGMMAVKGISHDAYFDLKKFCQCVDELDAKVHGEYNDNIQLILVNWYNGRLHFDESARINLEENFGADSSAARSYMHWLLKQCKSGHDVASLLKKNTVHEIRDRIRGLTVSDAINTACSIAGLFL